MIDSGWRFPGAGENGESGEAVPTQTACTNGIFMLMLITSI